MKVTTLIFSIIAGLFLQGCSSVVMPTVATLNALSPLEADPAGFEVRIDMPEGADIPVGGATFSFFAERSDTGEKLDQEYILQRREDAGGMLLFRIHPDDLDGVRAFQRQARAWEAEIPDLSSGGISVHVIACEVGGGVSDDARFSVSIKVAEGGLYLPLIRNVLVSDALENLPPLEEHSTPAKCG